MSEYNDEFLEEIKKNDILARYSIKAFIMKIIPSLLISGYILTLWNAIPEKGLKVAHLFLVAPFSFPPLFLICGFILIVLLNKVFLKNKTPILGILGVIAGVLFYMHWQMPNYRIDKKTLDIVMLSSSFLFLLQPIYFILLAKTGFVTANERKIEINEGVFNRLKDPTDMVNIDDCNEYRPFVYRLLGLSKLEIKLKKGNEIINLLFLTKDDAENLYNYIHAKAFNSSVEYWTTRDRLRNKNNQTKDSKYIEDIDVDNDDGEEIEPQE